MASNRLTGTAICSLLCAGVLGLLPMTGTLAEEYDPNREARLLACDNVYNRQLGTG